MNASRTAPRDHQVGDDELLARVARDRDRGAFEELYRRYQGDCFNIALHITGRRDLAEEAVQKAMLGVWQRAASYRPGKARAWLMRITANAGLQVLRSQRRRGREMNAESCDEVERPNQQVDQPEKSAERDELLDGLRQCLAALPDINRRLVALYYGAGLTQQEIGDELAMPTRTVSFKLEETLKLLRSRLTQVGLAAAVPLLKGDALREALCTGETPPALAARVMDAINRAAQYSQRMAAQASRTSLVTPVLIVAALALGAGGWWYFQSGEAPAAQLTPAVAANTPAQDALLFKRWDFKEGPPDDLRPFEGAWQWRKGLMELKGEAEGIRFVLPLEFRDKPVRITAKVVATRGGALSWNAEWLGADGTLPYHTWTGRQFRLTEANTTLSVVMAGAHIVADLNGKPRVVHAYDRAYPSSRLALFLRGYLIRSLEVRELTAEEIAAAPSPQSIIESLMQEGGQNGITAAKPYDWKTANHP